jgi:hypothetical protein
MKTKMVVLLISCLFRAIALTFAPLIVGGILVGGATGYAHHSFGATYDLKKTITIEGKLVQVLLRNPHSFFHVEALDENGELQRWSVEGAGATQMRQEGDKGLQLGDHIKVTVNPARSAEAHRGRLISILRPSDGWSWGGRAGQVVD